MHRIETTHFGTVSFCDDDVISFPRGLPGYASERRFIFLPHSSPVITYLQSVDRADLRFVLISAPAIDDQYVPLIEHSDASTLFPSFEEAQRAKLASWFVVSAVPKGEPTINMLAPIIVRLDERVAVQAVRSDIKYSHAAPLRLFQPIAKKSAC